MILDYGFKFPNSGSKRNIELVIKVGNVEIQGD